MADAEAPSEYTATTRRYWPRRRRWQVLLVLLIVLVVTSIVAWRSREKIADNLIASQLEQLGIEATYDIESIGPTRQVLTNVVIGDPARPDLSVERIELVPTVRWWGAGIGSVTVVRPRLRASYRDGKFSLGALDPLLEQESEQPFQLPGWKLNLIDARARLLTDYGAIGASADGSGPLNDGFKGRITVAAPALAAGDCGLKGALLGGQISVSKGQPGFEGPMRLQEISCTERDFGLATIDLATELTADRDLAGLSGNARISGDAWAAYGAAIDGVRGSAKFDWRKGIANARYDLSANEVRHPSLHLESLAAEGALRFRAEDGRVDLDAKLDGRELSLGADTETALMEMRQAGEGTLAAPLLVQFEDGLRMALPGSQFSAEVTFRRSDDGYSLVVPTARLRDRAGASLLALSQAQLTTRSDDGLRLAGNFATGGDGLPQIVGRMERTPRGSTALRLQMARYGNEDSSLAVPQLVLAQGQGGNWGIAGRVIASGAIPGGRVEDLEVPLAGNWSAKRGVALWQQCTELRFARLDLASLSLDQDGLTICPAGRSAILTSGPTDTIIAARSNGFELAGMLGDSPAKIASGEVRFTPEDGLLASRVEVTLGPAGATSRLAIREITGVLGAGIGGKVSGIEGGLAAVPLDIMSGESGWQYADGVLELGDASFELHDRPESGKDPRFYPLRARDARLRLEGDAITAAAVLRNPESDRVVTEFSLRHDLGTARGSADLEVPGLVFDGSLQPDDLTILASGVIALADGTITGSGRIDWDAQNITSSGAFSSDDFDFAAAFGPVDEVSGTVTFVDLLNLTTDGTQRLSIGSINPGVEVFDGTFDFALRDATHVSIKGGRWPFFGGTMELRPTELNLAVSEERSYVIEIMGADAAQFVAAMELGNINATGTFDGTVPLVFDEMGNGEIKNGLLISRPPGGNLSYVGELTYEDMGAIANFAFQSLRSLDFNQMMVEMNGPLTGEIVTRLLFDGIRQGEGASSNFVTKQIAKLPIRFNVNIRAAFYELLTSLHGMYDPAFIRDPRDLGLLSVADGRFAPARGTEEPASPPENENSDEPAIQRQESEPKP